MMAPKRIQRKRTKGWRMPEGAVYVGRPTKWGNPFTIDDARECGFLDDATDLEAREFVTRCFRDWLTGTGEPWWTGVESDARRRQALDMLANLRGKDLACWCPLDQPCHADVLLELANKEDLP